MAQTTTRRTRSTTSELSLMEERLQRRAQRMLLEGNEGLHTRLGELPFGTDLYEQRLGELYTEVFLPDVPPAELEPESLGDCCALCGSKKRRIGVKRRGRRRYTGKWFLPTNEK